MEWIVLPVFAMFFAVTVTVIVIRGLMRSGRRNAQMAQEQLAAMSSWEEVEGRIRRIGYGGVRYGSDMMGWYVLNAKVEIEGRLLAVPLCAPDLAFPSLQPGSVIALRRHPDNPMVLWADLDAMGFDLEPSSQVVARLTEGKLVAEDDGAAPGA